MGPLEEGLGLELRLFHGQIGFPAGRLLQAVRAGLRGDEQAVEGGLLLPQVIDLPLQLLGPFLELGVLLHQLLDGLGDGAEKRLDLLPVVAPDPYLKVPLLYVQRRDLHSALLVPNPYRNRLPMSSKVPTKKKSQKYITMNRLCRELSIAAPRHH